MWRRRRASLSHLGSALVRLPEGGHGWVPWRGRRTTINPEEPTVRQLAHRQPRLLVIVDPPPGPVADGLAVVGPVSQDLPGDCSPSRFGSECRPPRARFRMHVPSQSHKGLVHQLAARLQDLSTYSRAVWTERGEVSHNPIAGLDAAATGAAGKGARQDRPATFGTSSVRERTPSLP